MRNLEQRQKLTLRLSPDLYAATQEAVRLGLAPNQNAFIEDAIRMRTREIRHHRLRRLADEAMKDSGFVADMRGAMEDFRYVDQENWPSPPMLVAEAAPTKRQRRRKRP